MRTEADQVVISRLHGLLPAGWKGIFGGWCEFDSCGGIRTESFLCVDVESRDASEVLSLGSIFCDIPLLHNSCEAWQDVCRLELGFLFQKCLDSSARVLTVSPLELWLRCETPGNAGSQQPSCP